MSAIKLCFSPGEKFAFIGDLHFNETMSSRLDNYMEACCRKIISVGEICRQENVRFLFFSGDIFHRINCSHECVNKLGSALLSLQNKSIRLFSICGNHDIPRNLLSRLVQSPIETLFSFNILKHVSVSTPIEIYKTNYNNSCVSSAKITAVDYTQAIPRADDNFETNILLAHQFFDQSGFLNGPIENISREQMECYGYDMAFLGHDHEEHPPVQCGKTTVIRCGSLLRGTIHDYNFKREPGFVIVDDIFNPHIFRKVVVSHRSYKDIISQIALNKKTDSKSEVVNKESLRDLAGKLAASNEKDKVTDDVIYKTIKTDTQISDNRRRLLLSYINLKG